MPNNRFLPWLLCLALAAPAAGEDLPPMVDIHIHFNWDHEELVSAEEAVAILEDHNVVKAVAFSVPSDNVLTLAEAGGERIVPYFSPYITGRSRDTWYRDPRVLEAAREGLEQGLYQGIGELHLVPALGAHRDTPVFRGPVDLALEVDVPMLIHTEVSSHEYLVPLCQGHPELRILWAHAGGYIGPEHSRALLQACDNVWVELSARGPRHYGGLVEDDGRLKPRWARLFADFPGRFMVGTDPVWRGYEVTSWYAADEGWQHYDRFHDFHKGWLAQLPDDLARRLRHDNAMAFLEAGPAGAP